MKRIIVAVIALTCLLALVGCNNKTVSIDLPFEVEDIDNVEMYHYSEDDLSAEKKIIDTEGAIKGLYNALEDVPLKQKSTKKTAQKTVTSFRFNLSDGTSYELIYSCYGVKTGILESPTGNFEYFTISDIGSYWNDIGKKFEAVSVDKSELPK